MKAKFQALMDIIIGKAIDIIITKANNGEFDLILEATISRVVAEIVAEDIDV